MDQRVRSILAHMAEWRGKEAVVTPLAGGITNQNYRVEVGGDTFVLRVGGKGTHLLGIDRAREYACASIAAQVGIGAEVVRFLATDDALITRFVDGNGITPESAAQPAQLKRIVDAVRRYHSGPAFPGAFSPFAVVRDYHLLARQHGVVFPDTLPRAFTLMAEIERTIGSMPAVPCHNDLLASNFIDDGARICIIDWEYAAMGDCFFDLGNFAVNQELDDEQCALLLYYYFGEARPADLAHLHLMRLASDLRESFWGFLQLGISALDFDYREYGQQHLDRFLRNADTPQFKEWLDAMRTA
jgi:thiamine kinase-like enzyme